MAERPSGWRPAWAEIDVAAIRHNVGLLAGLCAPAALCAVVKADGYGHGAVAVSRAALEAGASWLAVALVEEGVALRSAGLDAPILLLSEPPPEAMHAAVAAHLTPTLYTIAGVAAAADAVGPSRSPLGVHLKVDTGMHRVGADPVDAVSIARAVVAARGLRLEGLWTHLAVADEPSMDAFTAGQLARFEEVRDALAADGISPGLLHAANSAGTLAHVGAHYDMVRCGIAVYGHPPGPSAGSGTELRPALSLKARVCLVRSLAAGERLSYGRRYALRSSSVVATVPLGYADGVPRRLSATGGQALVHGQRCAIAGTITMDQLMVDCGPGARVAVGDEVVLLGRQGAEEITAEEWAERLGTISYEVLCGIGPRVPRVHREGEAAAVRPPAQGALALGDE